MYSDSSGVEKTGGECRPMANMHSFFKSNTEGDFNVFKDDIAAYKAQRANWGWGDAEFAGFAKFDAVNSTTFQFGYGCSKILESKPAKVLLVKMSLSDITVESNIFKYYFQRTHL